MTITEQIEKNVEQARKLYEQTLELAKKVGQPKFEVGQYITCTVRPGAWKVVSFDNETVEAVSPNGTFLEMMRYEARPWLPAVGEEVWVDGPIVKTTTGLPNGLGNVSGIGKVNTVLSVSAAPYLVAVGDRSYWHPLSNLHPIAFAPKQAKFKNGDVVYCRHNEYIYVWTDGKASYVFDRSTCACGITEADFELATDSQIAAHVREHVAK